MIAAVSSGGMVLGTADIRATVSAMRRRGGLAAVFAKIVIVSVDIRVAVWVPSRASARSAMTVVVWHQELVVPIDVGPHAIMKVS